MLSLIRNRKTVLGLISLVIATAIISFAISAAVFYGWNYFNPKYQISFEPGTVSMQNIVKFQQVKRILERNYYQDVNDNNLLEGAIAGMADSLKDPYTVYFTKEQMAAFTEEISGSYVGIGISITLDKDGLVTVIEPFENSPAKEAGVLKGDKIIKVDDKDVSGLRDEDMVVKMIRGQEATKVKVTFYRPSEGRTVDLVITRKTIKIENIKSDILPGGIGYIKLIKFDAEINNYFQSTLDKMLAKGIKALIIDVRDNPGGRYDQVVAIADRLVPKGIIVYTEDKYKKRETQYSDAKELNLPMALLVNGNSASASEILAGALKDYKKAVLIGTKTFGKGLVQTDFPLADGSGIKVTIARYFTPSGVCIQGIGIQPDIEVQLDSRYNNTPVSQVPAKDDGQLQKAVEVLKEKIK